MTVDMAEKHTSEKRQPEKTTYSLMIYFSKMKNKQDIQHAV